MSTKKRLILIHGFTERPSMWDALIRDLNIPSVVVTTPSLPGHGSLREIPNERTAEAYCGAILKQIPDDDLPWVIIGHSMGGYLASTLVTMVAPRMIALGFFHSKASADDASKIEDRKRAIVAATQNKDLYLATMLRNTLAERNLDLLKNEVSTMIADAQMDITAECIEAAHTVMIQRPDNVAFLKQAKFSIHYFLGTEDKSIPYPLIKSELAELPSSHITVIQQVAHMGHIECPNEAIAWIRSLCSQE